MKLGLTVVKTKILEAKWQCSLTDMMLALIASSGMLSRDGRESARSTALVTSDGKNSLKYQVAQEVWMLTDKDTQAFMADLSALQGRGHQTLEWWTSHPQGNNHEKTQTRTMATY